MQYLGKPTDVCVICGKHADRVISIAPFTKRIVCSDCEKAFNSLIADYYKHARAMWRVADERPEEGIELFEKYLAENRHRDCEGWLARDIKAIRASLTSSAGRHGIAADLYREIQRDGFPSPGTFLVKSSFLAIELEELGRPQEAIGEMERALDVASPLGLHDALDLFIRYAATCKKYQSKVLGKYRDPFRRVLTYWGIGVPEMYLEPEMLTEGILRAAETVTEARSRYQSLLDMLGEIKVTDPERIEARAMLISYMEQEEVGLYLREAEEILVEIWARDNKNGEPWRVGLEPF